MVSFEILIIFSFFFILLYVTKGRVAAIWITALSLMVTSFGYFAMSTKTSDYYPASVYLALILSFLLGYKIIFRSHKDTFNARPLCNINLQYLPSAVSSLYVTFFILLFFTIYHYSVVGIPIFSSNVEIERFEFTNSGLFGLPGRVILFGIPIYYIIVNGFRKFSNIPYHLIKKPIYLSFGLLVFTRLAAGFKGAIVEIILITFFCNITSLQNFNLFKLLRRYSLSIFFAVAFAFGVARLYKTIALNYTSGVQYFIERLTTIAALPGYRVIQGKISNYTTYSNSLLNDLNYYLPKYFLGIYQSDVFPFVKIVSSSIYGTPLQADSFIVPVTIGALATLYYDFGAYSFLFSFILGVLFAKSELKAKYSQSILQYSIALISMVCIHHYMIRGDLIYNLLNWSIMSTFVFGVYFVFERILRTLIREKRVYV